MDTISDHPELLAPAQSVFDTVQSVHRAEGFEAGYRRAVNDLLADFSLVSKEFLREQDQELEGLRHALREFQNRFEQHLEQAVATSESPEGYFDGGLGI